MPKKVRNTEWDIVQRRLRDFVQAGVMEEGYVCYAAGMGGLPKSTYLELESIKGLKIIRLERFGAGSVFQKILSAILSSYWGVLKINDLSLIVTIFDKLTEQTMGELYIINKKDEAAFLSKIQIVRSPFAISDYVEQLTDFFIYQVDADNEESETGMVEIISYGSDCPKDLVDIVELTYFK